MPAAKNGEKPRPVSIAAATATGVPKPAAPSMNAPNANAISIACSRPVRGQAADRVLDDLEVARLERESVEHDGPVDDPRDRQEAERGAHQRRGSGELHRHAIDADRDDETGREAREPGDPRRLSQDADQEQQHEDRHGRGERSTIRGC